MCCRRRTAPSAIVETAPTPVELLGASLAACVAYYARRFLARHGLEDGSLRAHCDMDFLDHPWRVGALQVRVDVPLELSDAEHKALQRVVEHCTVHATLQQPPEIRIDLLAPVR